MSKANVITYWKCYRMFPSDSSSTTKKVLFLGIVYFGNDFSLFLCRNFKMRAGSTEFMEMLKEGKPCVSKSFSVVLNETIISRWANGNLNIDIDQSDFMSSINSLVQDASYILELGVI